VNSKKSALLWAVYIFIFIFSLYLVIVFSVWFGYENKFRPGVSVANASLSGLTNQEAEDLIDNLSQDFIKRDPLITINDKKYKASEFGLKFQAKKTITEISEIKRSPFNLGQKQNYPIYLTYDQNKLRKIIKEIEDKERQPVSNPKLKEGSLRFEEGKEGKRIIYGEAAYQFGEVIGQLGTQVNFKTTYIKPTYDSEELLSVFPVVNEKVKDGLVLEAGSQRFNVDKETLFSWATLEKSGRNMAQNYFLPSFKESISTNDYFSRSEVESYLRNLSLKINRNPVNATLAFEEKEVVIKSSAKSGLTLDVLESSSAILKSLNGSEKRTQLVIDKIPAEINENTIEHLGLKELVASGYSDFTGSPQNRRHNIKVGAEKFNGLILRPGEIFSFTKNMGAINAANGYLPELVIIGNETRPEYGGGLCQVSTTVFRAALNAGFPITARKAHSYPVTYYQPYGTDSTIYNPNPDLKFQNDTLSHLLIQTRVVGNKLYFDFYGTKNDINVKFAGNKTAKEAVNLVENVKPFTYDHNGRGSGSFKAIIYRFIYDEDDKLITTDEFFSNYDSPDKYPRPAGL
jgi:vancomycin resistance protein YoaR